LISVIHHINTGRLFQLPLSDGGAPRDRDRPAL
jgi:hypothetical protein